MTNFTRLTVALISIVFLSWTTSHEPIVTSTDNSFYLYYSFAGLGGNIGSMNPNIQIKGTKLTYTYEQNSSSGEFTKKADTILVTTVRISTLDSIKNILRGLKDTTIFQCHPGIMSGGIHFLGVAIGTDTISFTMMNTFNRTALKITDLLNTYFPADKKIGAMAELLIKAREDYNEYLNKEWSEQNKKNKK